MKLILATFAKMVRDIMVVAHWQINLGPFAQTYWSLVALYPTCGCSLNTKSIGKHKM